MSDVRKQIEKTIERLEKSLNRFKSTIENIAAYTAKSLANAPTRVKTEPSKNISSGNANYASVPTKLYIPDPNGGMHESDETMEHYLKRIRGGYRATGAGSFEAHKNKYHEARAFRHMQRNIGSEYIFGAGSTRVRERTRETYQKGTGKIHAEERRKLQEYRRQEAELRRKLLTDDRNQNSRKIQERLRALDKKINTAQKQGEKQLARLKRREKKSAAAFKKRMSQTIQKQRERREKRLAKWREKNIRYRIVARLDGDVLDPQPRTILRKGAAPGKPPKSWPGKGKSNYYISQMGTSDGGKKKWFNHYEVRKNDDWNWVVRLAPMGGGRTPHVLNLLEKGGTVETTPYVKGYLVTTQDMKAGHRRVSFSKVHSGKKRVSIAPRPWVSPTLQRVQEYIKKKNMTSIDSAPQPTGA